MVFLHKVTQNPKCSKLLTANVPCVLDTQSIKTYRETKPSFDVTNRQSNHEYNEGCTNETNVNSTIHHDKAQNVCQLCFHRRLSQVWVPASTLRQPCCPQSILFMLTALHHKHPTDWTPMLTKSTMSGIDALLLLISRWKCIGKQATSSISRGTKAFDKFPADQSSHQHQHQHQHLVVSKFIMR